MIFLWGTQSDLGCALGESLANHLQYASGYLKTCPFAVIPSPSGPSQDTSLNMGFAACIKLLAYSVVGGDAERTSDEAV